MMKSIARLCLVSDYFDPAYPTPKTLEEYETAPLLPGMIRYTPEQLDAAAAEIAAEQAAAAARKIWKTVADFYAEFTGYISAENPGEKYLLATSTHPMMILAREELAMWRGEVWSDDPRIVGGLDGMVALGILSAGRKAEILAL
jgi:hypothetical protein